MNRPLSNLEIMAKIPCKFMIYDDMRKVKNIANLLPETLILYQPEDKSDVGHFTCIFSNRDGVNYFDPLGGIVDKPLTWGKGGGMPYLTRLMAVSPICKKITYNEKPLQNVHTSTCGYWCAIRMLYKDLTNDEFNECFKHLKTLERDDMIVKLFSGL